MKRESSVYPMSAGNGVLAPFGNAAEGHAHYCSTCWSYWDHEDSGCANLGRSMICPSCVDQLLDIAG